MSSIPTPTASADPGTLHAAIDGRMAHLGAGEAVFFDASNGTSHVMTADVARAFGLCQPFLPLHEHVLRIMQAMPALKGQGAAVQKVLEMLVGRGLMQADVQFLARYADVPQATAQAPVSGLFLRAPARSGVLRGALDALATHVERFGFAHPLHVLDIEAEGALASEHEAAIGAFARRSGVRTHRHAARDLARLVESLVKAMPEQAQTIRWLLTPAVGSDGAARNLALLLAAGTRHLFLDAGDDLPLRPHPEAGSGLRADARAFALRSYGALQELAAAAGEPEQDGLAQQLDACGRSLAEAMAADARLRWQRAGLVGVAAAGNPKLRPQQRIAFTTVGRAGCFNLDDPTLPFKLGEAERAGLVASRENYLANYRKPVLWSGLAHPTIGVDGGVPLAFDAARLVPCTVPTAAHAAQLQVSLMRLAQPDGVDLGFPLALAHQTTVAGSEDALGRPDSAQCLAGLAEHVAQDLHAIEPATRLAVLAAKLDDLAGASDAALGNYLSEYLAWYRSSNVERMQQAMAVNKTPPVFWLADLRAAVEAQGRALAQGETPRLAGWPASFDRVDCVARFRSELLSFGAALRLWPALFERAARENAGWRDVGRI